MAITSASGIDRTYQWAAHIAWGYPFNLLHNVIEHTFGYTHHKKVISAGTAGAIHAAIATVVAGSTTTTGFTNPDVPRVLAVTTGGTTADFAASTLTIVGTNVEGKTITDVLAISDNQAGQTVGTLVFKAITSVALNKADGTGGTYTIDTTNKIGLNHRIPANFGTIVEVSATKAIPVNIGGAINKPVLLAAPTASNVDGEFVEKNYYTSATTPDGTTSRYAFYWFHKALVYPPKDSPEFYSTTTSTSSSTSSTSTSSTSLSTSTSISSTSTSSTSSSTSSTSTSTTTLPV